MDGDGKTGSDVEKNKHGFLFYITNKGELQID